MKDLKISKELLIEVLGSEYKQRLVDWFQIEDDNFLRTYYDCGSYDDKGRPTGLGLEINIYEFAFKCKEWALKKEFIVHSSPTQKKEFTSIAQNFNMNQFYYGKNQFYALTEIEAIFLACEYILNNIKK